MNQSGYILPKKIRRAFLFGGAMGVLACAAIGVWLWWLAPSGGVYGMLALLFAALVVCLVISYLRSYQLIHMRYEIRAGIVRNFRGKEIVTVTPVTSGNTVLCLAMGKGNLDVELVLLTQVPHFANTYTALRGLNAIAALWRAGIVLVPKGAWQSVN